MLKGNQQYSLDEIKAIVNVLLSEGEKRKSEVLSENEEIGYELDIFLSGYNGAFLAFLSVMKELEKVDLEEDDYDSEEF